MRILYFSRGYSTHDYRFLASLAKTKHEVFFLQLEAPPRQTEDRPLPRNIQHILWAGGKHEFRWRELPRLIFDFQRLTKEIKPDLVHAGPVQTCAFIAVLSGFRPILTMSWGYDLVQEAERNSWMKWVTRYTLKRSAFFVSDAKVSRDKAVAFGMNLEKTVIFPWGIDLRHFGPKPSARPGNRKSITLFCNRAWEAMYGVDVLAKAFVKVVASNPKVNLIL